MGQDGSAQDEDMEAISRCRRGDDSAFEGLVVKYQKKMLNMAYRITGSYEDACEVVQDAFLSAHRGMGNFRGQSSFSTWLSAITLNSARSRVQQMASRSGREPCSFDDPVSAEDDTPRQRPAAGPSPLEILEKRERDLKIQECISSLDPEFRSVIVLRDVQGFSYDEISHMLKVAAGTVKSRLFRARESVRNCLKRVMGGL